MPMMLNKNATVIGTYSRFKPHILMVLAQIAYTLLYFITEASFNHGMNPHVYMTYRHVVAGFVMLPFAYFFERKIRPKLTMALFVEIFVLSLLGIGLTLNMYFASLRYTSPTFLASMVNTVASLTFVIAVALRLEFVDLRNPRGIAKVLGTIISLAGVTIMTLYKGPVVKNLGGNPLIHLHGKGVIKEDWLKGSLLTVASCITWSIWYIMQAFTLKRYPAQLSLTTWMCFVGAAQSAFYAAIVQRKPAAWAIGFNVDLWSTLYAVSVQNLEAYGGGRLDLKERLPSNRLRLHISFFVLFVQFSGKGIVISGLVIFVQLWCTEEKGPVFVTVFNPLSTILVAALAYFVFGEKLYMGSILGGVVVIIGLYLLLWGKDRDQDTMQLKEQSSLASEEHENAKVPTYSSIGVNLKEEP